MTWPAQTPEAIAERIATKLEGLFEGLDARSGKTFASVLTIAQSMEVFDVHLFLRLLIREAFPHSARITLEWHAATWNVERVQATRARGAVTFASAQPGTTILAGTALLRGNLTYRTTTSATAGVDGTVTVTALADVEGEDGNALPGAVLTLVSPLPRLTVQAATVGEEGISGGAEQEQLEALRDRVLAAIRSRGRSGKATDYEDWARAASAAISQVRVVGQWANLGTVGVIIAMSGPRAPTSDELALVAAAIEAERPVTAQVIVVPAVMLPVTVRIRLMPDTVATRAAVEAELRTFFLAEATIAGTVARSRISGAISEAAGEYSHELLLPAADVVPGPAQLPVFGSLEFA